MNYKLGDYVKWNGDYCWVIGGVLPIAQSEVYSVFLWNFNKSCQIPEVTMDEIEPIPFYEFIDKCLEWHEIKDSNDHYLWIIKETHEAWNKLLEIDNIGSDPDDDVFYTIHMQDYTPKKDEKLYFKTYLGEGIYEDGIFTLEKFSDEVKIEFIHEYQRLYEALLGGDINFDTTFEKDATSTLIANYLIGNVLLPDLGDNTSNN